ncbi:MAG: DUF2157 domain-containing protein [Gemmatimonadota bacterium]
MARRARRIEEALKRWVDKGLVDPELAAALRDEAEVAHRADTRRWGQLLVAILGAIALVLAAGLFAERSWDTLTDGARTGLLLAVGGAAYLLGLAAHRRAGWEIPGTLIQAGGQAVILVGLTYSATIWDSGSPGAWATGLAALLILAVLAPVGLHEGVLMTAVQTAFSLLYLAVFLERAVGLEGDAIVWTLDGVVAVSILVQLLLVGRWDAERQDRALMALATSLWAGLVLALVTGLGPMDASPSGVLGMDLWWALMVGLTLWGIHKAPGELRRDAYEVNLALCVVVGGLMLMYTVGETFQLDSAGAGLIGVLVGGLGLGYGLRYGATAVLVSGSLVALLATWVFAIGQAGALGGVVALLVSAAALFWLSTRLRAVDAAPPPA